MVCRPGDLLRQLSASQHQVASLLTWVHYPGLKSGENVSIELTISRVASCCEVSEDILTFYDVVRM